ncbi:unnamed protein product [Mytilus edulis]|uniref:Endonuclease/exonuclease/phosphatase domain-containing protein n=1 Tax=Mytilus edulis TaxID=6550 RepID=A0A8S3SHN6_MYTED|nr:unnamed protein product [Mytilus edulis]
MGISDDIILTGDLNFHLDDKFDCDARKFTETLSDRGLVQHVVGATHVRGHTLDVIITREDSSIVIGIPSIEELHLCNDKGVPSLDHFAVHCSLNVNKPPKKRESMKFRKLEEIVIDDFNTDINCSNFMPNQTATLDELVSTYDSVLSSIIEKHAPMQSKTITLRPNTEWHSSELRTAKTERRKAERKMRKTKLEVHKQLYKEQCIKTHKLLLKCKTDYYSDKILEIGCDQKKLFNLTNKLMGNTKTVVLPSRECDKDISNRFGDFFLNKIETIMRCLSSEDDSSLNRNDAFCADVRWLHTIKLAIEKITIKQLREKKTIRYDITE